LFRSLRCPYPPSLVPRRRRSRRQAPDTRYLYGSSDPRRHAALLASHRRALSRDYPPNQRCLRRRHPTEGHAMKPTDFSVHVSHFLTHHLAAQRNLSANTIKAYRDVFTLLLRFCRDQRGLMLERLSLDQIDAPLVEAFLDHLATDRK